MQHSDSIGKVMQKIGYVQNAMPKIRKDKTNPHLGNKFTSMGLLLRTLKPLLKADGLVVSQFPAGTNGAGITTVVCDEESGEWVAETMFIDPREQKGVQIGQVAGAYTTYIARYALGRIFLVDSDEDIDAQIPQPKKKAEPQKSATPIETEFKKLIGAHAILKGVYKGQGDEVGAKTLKEKVVNPLGAAIERMEKQGKIDQEVVNQAKKIIDGLAPPKA